MKRLVGGDYLLDLSSIEIEESEDGSTKTNITDADVLEQLTNLKKYVNNPEMAKPVWVKLKNGENDELVIARGTFAVIDTGEFEICVQLDGYKLVIFIEFTQATLEDDTPIDDWYIAENDAKYLFTSDAQNVKATIEDDDFGDVALAGDLSVGGDLSVTGTINGEENPSVKPVYCHPVYITSEVTEGGGKESRLMFLIFNNSSTAFTMTTFIAYIKGLMDNGAYIAVDGYIKTGESRILTAYAVFKSVSEYRIYGNDFTASSPRGNILLDDIAHGTINDGVNKIN